MVALPAGSAVALEAPAVLTPTVLRAASVMVLLQPVVRQRLWRLQKRRAERHQMEMVFGTIWRLISIVVAQSVEWVTFCADQARLASRTRTAAAVSAHTASA